MMAAVLAHDVAAYSVASGSTLFFCSLDAQGAFDALPHPIIFQKALGVIPDKCWCIMVYWYKHIFVNVKWRNSLSDNIPVKRGTRQGGLTSTLLFNLFYQDLVTELQSCNSGVIIGSEKYNTYCYADDLLLSSTTVTGLQKLINIATTYTSKNGLSFNTSKTECAILGINPFVSIPQWTINGNVLPISDSITYLGTVIGDPKGKQLVNLRASKANRAFYSLQGAGLNCNGVSPETALHIYKTAVRSSLTYGCAAVNISSNNLKVLDKVQGKHLKSILGLKYHSRTTPLLEALNIPSVSKSVQMMSLDLLKSCLLSSSSTQKFYLHMINTWKHGNVNCVKNTLLARTLSVYKFYNMNLHNHVFNLNDNAYVKQKMVHKLPCGQNGMVDTIRFCLSNENKHNHAFLNMILKSF